MKRALSGHGSTSIIILVAALSLVSCTEQWDEHYYKQAAGKSELSLFEFIESQSDLTIFTSMLQQTGYDTVLNKSQVYTVWAPTNEALQGFDLLDSANVLKIVTGHIAWFSYPVREAQEKTIIMLNNKRIFFTTDGTNHYFDGKLILRQDQAVRNGLVHVLDGYVPYRSNIWEYLLQASGIDSLQTYINSLFSYELDGEASFDENGMLIDSVLESTNYFLTNLGAFDNEDSVYTCVIPDNEGWNEGLARISPYFNILESEGGAAVQTAYSKLYLVNNLFFSGRYKVPVSSETLTSTGGMTFTNPDTLFSGGELIELSNGYVYKTSSFPYLAAESWLKEVRVEAEDSQDNFRLTNNYKVNTTSSVGTGYDVSGGYYITAVPTSSSATSKLFVRFPITSVLSTKYNIYVVFVPSCIIDKTDKRPYKVNFYLSYIDEKGESVSDSKIVSNAITDSTSMTKMLVAENFQFSYCNINTPQNSTVNIRVENAATVKATEYNRTIRIDCIILEPVQ